MLIDYLIAVSLVGMIASLHAVWECTRRDRKHKKGEWEGLWKIRGW